MYKTLKSLKLLQIAIIACIVISTTSSFSSVQGETMEIYVSALDACYGCFTKLIGIWATCTARMISCCLSCVIPPLNIFLDIHQAFADGVKDVLKEVSQTIPSQLSKFILSFINNFFMGYEDDALVWNDILPEIAPLRTIITLTPILCGPCAGEAMMIYRMCSGCTYAAYYTPRVV